MVVVVVDVMGPVVVVDVGVVVVDVVAMVVVVQGLIPLRNSTVISTCFLPFLSIFFSILDRSDLDIFFIFFESMQ